MKTLKEKKKKNNSVIVSMNSKQQLSGVIIKANSEQ